MVKAKILVVTAIMMIMIIVATPVFAAEHTFTFTLNPQTVSVRAGETVTINLGIADIDQSTDGITAIQGEILYNTEIFENVNFKPTAENWTGNANFNEAGNGTFALYIMGSDKETKDVAKLTATVKKDVELETATITFKDVFSSYQDLTETERTTKIFTVNIEEGSSHDEDGDKEENIIDDDTNKVTPSNPDKNSSITPSSQTDQGKSSSKSILPKAGIESWIAIFIVAVIIVGIIEFIKYKRITK